MQNEKAVQGGAKKMNGPVAGEKHKHEVDPLDGVAEAAKAVADAATTEGTVEAPKKPERKVKPLAKSELVQLFKTYDAEDAKYEQAVKALLDAKRARSKVVEEIYFGSEKKSFRMKDKGDVIWTIMVREDKKEDSPTLGVRFYYFRRPSVFDPLDI